MRSLRERRSRAAERSDATPVDVDRPMARRVLAAGAVWQQPAASLGSLSVLLKPLVSRLCWGVDTSEQFLASNLDQWQSLRLDIGVE
jgi:hypothetical protein